MQSLSHIVLVALGSALGGLARWGAGNLVTHFLGMRFPWGTLLINISGSALLGWFVTLLDEIWVFSPDSRMHAEEWRLLVAVGFTGAYTTFSTFEGETYRLFRTGMTWSAIFYLTGSVFLGLLAFRVGILLAGGE